MGIKLPSNCRVETTIENHEWLGDRAPNFKSDNGPIIICNVGGGNVARAVYRVVSYAHDHSTVGKFKKQLLHEPTEQQAKNSSVDSLSDRNIIRS